jgi:hypothetical protein
VVLFGHGHQGVWRPPPQLVNCHRLLEEAPDEASHRVIG